MWQFSYQVCSCFLNFPHNYILLLFCITVKHNTCFKLQPCSKYCNSLLRHKVPRHYWSAKLHNCVALKSKYKWKHLPVIEMTVIKKNVSHQSTEGKNTHSSDYERTWCSHKLENRIKITWHFLCSFHQCLLCAARNIQKQRKLNSCPDHLDLWVTISAPDAGKDLNDAGVNSTNKTHMSDI